jgi:hypothetical protein
VTISYAAYKSKSRRKLECELKERLETLEQTESKMDSNTFDEYQLIKKEYESIQKTKMQGILIRSRAKYIEEGEKNTKYFLNLEKKKSTIETYKDIN